MSKLSRIHKIVEESRELVQEVHNEAKEVVDAYNLALEEFEVVQQGIKEATVPQLQEVIEEIENLPPFEQEPEIVEEGEKLQKLDAPEPYQVEEPKAGTFKAKLVGFFFFIVTFAGLSAAGAYMRHIDFMTIDLNNWKQIIQQIFGFYSDLITQTPQSGPALGGVLILTLSFVIGYMFYFLLVNGAARNNLKRAEAMFEEVKAWVDEQRVFIEKVKALHEALKEGVETLQGLKAFGEEFAARSKRILFFEGNDFTSLSQKAQDEVRTAQTLLAKLSLLGRLKLYAKDLELSQSVQSVLYEARSFMELLKGKING